MASQLPYHCSDSLCSWALAICCRYNPDSKSRQENRQVEVNTNICAGLIHRIRRFIQPRLSISQFYDPVCLFGKVQIMSDHDHSNPKFALTQF